jgi:hypothetical protein
LLLAGLLGFAWALCGCSSQSTGCRSDAECGGGACVDGECRPVVLGGETANGGGDDGGMTTPEDMVLVIPDGWNPDQLAASCTFNNDGVIDRSEMPAMVGLGGLFAVNASGSTVAVNLNTPWDFSAAVTGERKVFDQLISPSGQWWSSSFSNADFAQRIDDGQALWGVYKITPTALQLLGVVSDQSGAQQTQLSYATPIDVVRFPLKVGDSWSSESDVSGTADGVAMFAHEKYDFTVPARGNAKIPAGTFDTLRLRMGYTQTYGLLVTTRITYLHIAECYGMVARIRSQDNETQDPFDQAAEYRRLASP